MDSYCGHLDSLDLRARSGFVRHRPGHCQRSHVCCARRPQDPRTRRQRRARRPHVVHEDDGGTRECPSRAAPTESQGQVERARDVFVPDVRVQRGLSLRAPATPERAHHREAQVTGQFMCLVEPAFASPRSVQWHRHDEVDGVQDLRVSLAHQRPQRVSKARAAPELEPVDDLSQGAVVRSERGGMRDVVQRFTSAQRAGSGGARPRRSGDGGAAGAAQRRREETDGVPAGRADGAARRRQQPLAARDTPRREEEGERGVDRTPRPRGDPLSPGRVR